MAPRRELSTRFAVPDARYTAKTIPGKLAIQPASFDFNYTTPAPFCKADKLEKGKCTVQLNFIDGKPVLRLCSAKGQPGRTIPLTDATAARRIAKAACSSFNVNKVFPESFTDTSDEDIEYDERVEVAGLGKRSQASRSTHERSERLWAAVERARTREEREEARAAAEAFDARLAGRKGTSMLKSSSFGQIDYDNRTFVDRMVADTGGPDAGSPERRKIVPELYRAFRAHGMAVAKRDRAAIKRTEEEWLRAEHKFNEANDPEYYAKHGWSRVDHPDFYARFAGTGGRRMMTLSLAGGRKPSRRAPKARTTKTKWCVYTKTKSGARKLSCHKLKRTAQAAAKKRKGATVRKGK